MKAQDLKNSILQLAMEGNLVPQDETDESAFNLIEMFHDKKLELIKNKEVIHKSKPSIIFKSENKYFEKRAKKSVDITNEIPFNIPHNWAWCRLSSANDIFTGNSINKTEKESKFMGLDDGFNYIATKDVSFDNLIDYDNGVKIPDGLEKFKVANKFSILLCIEGGSAGRKIALTNQNVCFGNKLCCFTSFGVNNYFLYYYLQSPIFKDIFKSKKTGIIGGVGVGEIRKLFLPVPPLNEQKRIVEKIENLLPYIEKYGEVEEELTKLNNDFPNQIKKSVLQYAVQGKLLEHDNKDESAKILLEKIKYKKEQLIKNKIIKRNNKESFIFREDGSFYEMIGKNGDVVCIDENVPFDIPDSWEWCRLESISFITKLAGFEYTKYISPNLVKEGIPLLKAKNVKNNKLIKKFDAFIPKNVSNKLIRSKLNKRCLLTPYVGASIGNIVIFDGSFEAHLAPNLAKIELFDNKFIFEEYLSFYLKSFSGYNELTKYLKSTAQPSISMAALRDILVPVPPVNEQSLIVRKLNLINKLF
ncbi:MAG: restriction endonuclease subunit S [Methanobacteriaceae archaeon]